MLSFDLLCFIFKWCVEMSFFLRIISIMMIMIHCSGEVLSWNKVVRALSAHRFYLLSFALCCATVAFSFVFILYSLLNLEHILESDYSDSSPLFLPAPVPAPIPYSYSSSSYFSSSYCSSSCSFTYSSSFACVCSCSCSLYCVCP